MFFAADALGLGPEAGLHGEHRVRQSGRLKEDLRRQHLVYLAAVTAERQHQALGLQQALVVGADRVDWAALFDQTTVEPLDVVAVGALHEGVDVAATHRDSEMRSEQHTSELQSLMRTSY